MTPAGDVAMLCAAHCRLPAPARLPADVDALLNAPAVPESRFELAQPEGVRCPTNLQWAFVGHERRTI